MKTSKKRKKIKKIKKNGLQSKKQLIYYMTYHGAVAQLARASHWQCEGREFESLLLHQTSKSRQIF